MTIPSTTRKAGPLLGTGVQTAWPFTFKVFTGADVLVAIADSTGAETTLVLDTDYSVTLNANQDTSPGGTVTYPLSGAPLAVGSTITVVGDIDYDQPLDLPAGGNFSPTAIENELDRLMMQIQQLREITTRAFLSPVSSNASGQLPAPAANTLIGWDTTGTSLQNVPLSSISTSATYGAMTDDPFTGDGVTTSFLLTHDPIVLANMTVVVDGFTLKAGTAFTLSAGSAVFAVAPSLGAKIVVRYGQTLDVGTLLSTGIGDSTATGRSLLTAANAAAARTAIGAQASLGFTPAAAGANTDITSLSGVRTIQPISASVASNALTISASSLSLDFRSTTLGSGAVTNVLGTPANLVISSGSTLGCINAVQSRIIVLAINNAGTIELAAVNISGGVDLSETGLISTTAEGGAGAADSANVIYSTTARTNVAYRVIGYIESTQATAGTWATAPSTIQGYGGQAVAAMSSAGYGQTWKAPATYVIGTTYYNTAGKKKTIVQWATANTGSQYWICTINGVGVISGSATPGASATFFSTTIDIPPGASFIFTVNGGNPSSYQSWELS